MANSIALAQKFLPILDEVYKREALTSRLDAANSEIQWIGADTVKLFKTSVPGLGNYNRSTGYPHADLTSTWETLQLTKDRGVDLIVDRMDNEETLGMAFGTLVGEFMRTQVVPEIDAYRFAVYAANAGTKVNADITVGTTDVPGLIATAEQVMGDAEVPREGRILFISETAYNGLQNKITRYLANEGAVSRMVESYNGMEVVRVPKGRFSTAITLYDGSANFGFVPTASTGYEINFMIVHPSAVKNAVKLALPKIFSPDENQSADAWKFQYREYHDAFVLANKVNGIYLHRKSTAIS